MKTLLRCGLFKPRLQSSCLQSTVCKSIPTLSNSFSASHPYSAGAEGGELRGSSLTTRAPAHHPATQIPSQHAEEASASSGGGERMFDVDWSVFSASGLGDVFRELLADLLGAPPPPASSGRLGRWPRGKQQKRAYANMEQIYAQQQLRRTAAPGFLVRGIIYDMSALMLGLEQGTPGLPPGSAAAVSGDASQRCGGSDSASASASDSDPPSDPEAAAKAEVLELVKKHWEGLGVTPPPAHDASKPVARTTQGISIDELTDQLGLGSLLPSVTGRVEERLPPGALPSSARPGAGGAAAGASAGRSAGAGAGGGGAGGDATGARGSSGAVSKERELEELLGGGTGGGVRAKYAARLREKRVMAETRREQARFGVAEGGGAALSGMRRRPAIGSVAAADAKDWIAMPGSAGLLRYFQERRLSQGLLAEGPPDDVALLLDQLGAFPFDPTLLRAGAASSASPAYAEKPLRWAAADCQSLIALNLGLAGAPSQLGLCLATAFVEGAGGGKALETICRDWKLEPKQVMLVVGVGRQAEEVLSSVANRGFFVCQVSSAYKRSPAAPSSSASTSEEPAQLESHAATSSELSAGVPQGPSLTSARSQQSTSSRRDEAGTGRGEKGGVLEWYRKLSEGTLHVEKGASSSSKGPLIHFTVGDMTELKWVIEDLNGVSYRRSTFLRSK
eukprot:jgi/Mesen1/2658/ME000167S01807